MSSNEMTGGENHIIHNCHIFQIKMRVCQWELNYNKKKKLLEKKNLIFLEIAEVFQNFFI